MGEKIKDLHTITIGDASLMIELNEGYSSSQGRLIHIQNKKFRLLLKEKDFYQLSSMVMRGWSEFEYIKSKSIGVCDMQFKKRSETTDATLKVVDEIRELFASLKYRFLDLQDGLATMIVHRDDLIETEKRLKKHGWKLCKHPYGIENGYKFLYQMNPFKLFRMEGVYLEIFCQLPCASLTENTWIPLDRAIQTYIWKDEDVIDRRHWANIPCQYLYHLSWAVFFNKAFSPYEKEFLKTHNECLQSKEMGDLIKTVFFGFSEKLIGMLQNEQFDSIIPEYFAFTEY